MRILVVDDETHFLSLFELKVKKFGVERVIMAPSVDVALMALDTLGDTVDLLVTDLNMPMVGGLELLKELADRKFQGAVAIISGASMDTIETAESFAMESDLKYVGRLGKSFTNDELSRLLHMAAA